MKPRYFWFDGTYYIGSPRILQAQLKTAQVDKED